MVLGNKMKTEAVRNKMKKKGKGEMKRKKRKIGFYIKKKTTRLFCNILVTFYFLLSYEIIEINSMK